MHNLEILHNDSNDVCIIDNTGKKYSYKKINTEIDQYKNYYSKRSLILIISSSTKEFIVHYLSFLKFGHAQIILNENINDELLKRIITKYKPNYILLKNNKIRIHKKYNLQKKTNKKLYKIYKSTDSKKIKLYDSLAVLLSTSGSTGSLKFVKQTYENINANTESISKYLNLKPNDRSVTNLPLNYSYGLSVVNSHLYIGGSIYISSSNILEKNFWDSLFKYKITNLNGVPYFYEILKKINFEKFNLTHINFFTQAGGPLEKKINRYLVNFCKKNRKKFIVMYGQTEATSRISFLQWKYALTKIGSIGKAIPGGFLKIKDDKKKGELIYQGKNVTIGYSNNFQDLNFSDSNDGTLSTGDIAKKDKDGFFYIIGRINRNVKIYGFRINLDDLEKKLSSNIVKCACIGKDDLITIFFTKEIYREFITKKLVKVFKFKINNFKLVLIKKLPYSTNGKLLYSKLNENTK